MSRNEFSFENLSDLYRSTPLMPLRPEDRLVIFSDLHLGNGTRSDDFAPNSELFTRVLRDYYFDEGYTLILNGDIEELQRSSRLFRLVGNHDLDLMDRSDHRTHPPTLVRVDE